jgi:hypothetical protein
MGAVKHLDIKEFREEGYLQEVNRRFLHPLGLALEGTVEEDGSESISGIWDCRDDPEGIWFEGTADAEKVRRVNELFAERAAPREARLGFVVEPVGDTLTVTPGDALSNVPAFLGWLREHGIDPEVTFRVEVAGDAMTVHRYRLNAEGKKFIEEDGPAVEEPLTIPCKRSVPCA